MSGLTDLLQALGADAKLEKEFHDDPDAVMARFGVDDRAREALRNGDTRTLSELSGLKDVSLSNGTIKSYS